MIRYAFAFVLLSSVAYAGDNNGPQGGNSSSSAAAAAVAISGSKSSASVRSNINVSNRVTNKQAQGQFQGQGQEASANNSGVNINHERAIIAPSLGGFASGPCTGVGGQVSVGVAGFGGGAGFTALDGECTRRETARVLHMLGQTEAAVQLMMAAPILQGITPAPKRTTEVPAADTSDYCARNKTDYYCQPKS